MPDWVRLPIVPLYFAADRQVVICEGTLIAVDDERMRFGPGEKVEDRIVRFRRWVAGP
jgi:sulfate adenylyltransferase subunit 2